MERPSPTISVVVPAFDAGRFLASTLESVRGQSFESWECIVVDDGSSDGTRDVAEAFAAADSRFRSLSIPNRGECGARNVGFRATSPDSRYVAFMDSDDVWLPQCLESLRARLESDTAAVGAHGLAETIDEDGSRVAGESFSTYGRRRTGVQGGRLVEWPRAWPTTFDVLINGCTVFPPGVVLARREAVQRAGRFDERFTAGGDWDMLIRLSRQGHLSFVDDVVLLYRKHRSNMSAKPGADRQIWLVRCKGFHSPENDAGQRDSARRGWRAYQRNLLRQRVVRGFQLAAARRLGAALGEVARVPVHALRLVRGYPTPRLVRASEPW